MKRLAKQLKESLGLRERGQQEVFNDLLIHAIASGKDLKETYQMLLDTFGCEYTVDIDIMSKVAHQKETVMLVENDKAISLWARLLGTYKEHINNPILPKYTSTQIPNDVLHSILGYDTNADGGVKSKHKSIFSRARKNIVSVLPRGTTLVHSTGKDTTKFTFISAETKEDTHKVLVDIGTTSNNLIDRVLAELGIHEEIL